MRNVQRNGLLILGLTLLLGGCIPYAVGTTAQPVARGRLVPTASIYFVPGGVHGLALEEGAHESETGSYAAVDFEARYGVDEASDLGVRITGGSGVVINYKRRLTRAPDALAPALAALLGTGIVNVGEHAHLEASLLASGRQSETLTPYGGLRAMQVLPLHSNAVSDSPTLGLFVGARIGRTDLGLSPELAVYHDRSALGLREGTVIVVPSFTFHGTRMVRLARYFLF